MLSVLLLSGLHLEHCAFHPYSIRTPAPHTLRAHVES
jgi:hypothetical protein